MITCIYDYISKNKCIKCMILMHEIACYHYSSLFYSLSNIIILFSLSTLSFLPLLSLQGSWFFSSCSFNEYKETRELQIRTKGSYSISVDLFLILSRSLDLYLSIDFSFLLTQILSLALSHDPSISRSFFRSLSISLSLSQIFSRTLSLYQFLTLSLC